MILDRWTNQLGDRASGELLFCFTYCDNCEICLFESHIPHVQSHGNAEEGAEIAQGLFMSTEWTCPTCVGYALHLCMLQYSVPVQLF